MTTKEETLRRIAVMQAWCDGEKIEIRSHLNNRPWALMITDPDWTWDVSDYRIAPKPKRKVIFKAYIDGNNELHYRASAPPHNWKHIPTLDLEAEVDD